MIKVIKKGFLHKNGIEICRSTVKVFGLTVYQKQVNLTSIAQLSLTAQKERQQIDIGH